MGEFIVGFIVGLFIGACVCANSMDDEYINKKYLLIASKANMTVKDFLDSLENK